MLKRRPTTGFKNTANGNAALLVNKAGNGNTAEGAGALGSNTGSFNAAVGFNAGANLTTGSNNIDIGNVGVAGAFTLFLPVFLPPRRVYQTARGTYIGAPCYPFLQHP